MKKTDLKSWRGKKVEELKKVVIEKRLLTLKTMVKVKAGQEKNLKKAKNLKKELAQMLTIIRESEIIGNKQLDSKIIETEHIVSTDKLKLKKTK